MQALQKVFYENCDPVHQGMANALRFLAIDAVEKAKSGHPGMPMGMADVATVLFREFLNFNPKDPKWINRDRFVLSAGHGSMLLYALLHLTGYEHFPLDQLKKFRQLGSHTAGHPEYDGVGVETTTGPLGQGLATAVGMALSRKMLSSRHGDDLITHKIYVMASDGDLMEGLSHEAISFAGHYKLSDLIVFWDDNHISIDGSTQLSVSDHQMKRFEACNWKTIRVDGHGPSEIRQAIAQSQLSDKPVLIACRTTIGFGSPNKGGTANCHGSPLGEAEIALTRKALGWDHAPFEVPNTIYEYWKQSAARGSSTYASWMEKANGKINEDVDTFENALESLRDEWLKNPPKSQATRQLSQEVLEKVVPLHSKLVGGSADLTPSNNTRTKSHHDISVTDFSGSYLHYGVREHAMASIMNGLSLHGDWVPYGGTFLIFSDYLRPALRLSALMKRQVIYVLTHDSIGLGEDGPTHQPIEHLASLRAMPNVLVLRPADAVETAECWQIALSYKSGPCVLALSRQSVGMHRKPDQTEAFSQKGAYLLCGSLKDRDITLIASGSEVTLAVQAFEQLKEEGIKSCVVSIPCFELFDAQSTSYKQELLGNAPRIGIEAATSFGWDRYIGSTGAFIGIDSFGASASEKDLYFHFGITKDQIVRKAKEFLTR